MEELVQWALCSRAEFESLARMPPSEVAALDDVTRAWRLLYILKNSFAGRGVGAVASGWQGGGKPAFGYWKTNQGFFYGGKPLGRSPGWHFFQKEYPRFSARIRRVLFECLDYSEILARYDHANSFFYLDPPYLGSDDYYGGSFGVEEHRRMAPLLSGLAGKFILSLNERPEFMEIYGGFHIHTVETIFMCGNKKRKESRHGELVISNFDLDGDAMIRAGVKKLS